MHLHLQRRAILTLVARALHQDFYWARRAISPLLYARREERVTVIVAGRFTVPRDVRILQPRSNARTHIYLSAEIIAKLIQRQIPF